MGALRKLRGIRVGSCSVTIYRDPEWEQYVVKTRYRSVRASYFTDDKQDARDTAAAEVRRLRRLPKCRASM